MTCQKHTTTQHPTFGVYFKNLQKTHPYAQFLFASNTGRDEPLLCNTQLAGADIDSPPPRKGGGGSPRRRRSESQVNEVTEQRSILKAKKGNVSTERNILLLSYTFLVLLSHGIQLVQVFSAASCSAVGSGSPTKSKSPPKSSVNSASS